MYFEKTLSENINRSDLIRSKFCSQLCKPVMFHLCKLADHEITSLKKRCQGKNVWIFFTLFSMLVQEKTEDIYAKKNPNIFWCPSSALGNLTSVRNLSILLQSDDFEFWLPKQSLHLKSVSSQVRNVLLALIIMIMEFSLAISYQIQQHTFSHLCKILSFNVFPAEERIHLYDATHCYQ